MIGKSTRRMLLSFLTSVVLTLLGSTLHAQTGVIAGTVLDAETGETMIGATVQLQSDPNIGTSCDFEGRYRLEKVPVGEQAIVIRFVSYSEKIISEIQVAEGDVVEVNATMEFASETLGTVVIKSTFQESSAAAMVTMQKKAISVQDGVSRDLISRTPDSNTGEVLKRLPGTTLQGGKYVVVRGLADRYNFAMLNGMPLPTTEPDRKTFAFDLYPSGMLDNLIITKTAQPDLPGEFAGGIIQLTTRDLPDDNFLEVGLGTSFNTATTFQDFADYQGGGLDWLGVDDGTRAIPDEIAALTPAEYRDLGRDTNGELTELVNSDLWALDRDAIGLPGRSLSISGGFNKGVGKGYNRFGGIFGLSYSGSDSRVDYDEDNYTGAADERVYEFDDIELNRSVTTGILANLGYRFNGSNEIALRTSYSINADDKIVLREGFNFLDGVQSQRRYYEYISRSLTNVALTGEHQMGKIKLDWATGYDQIVSDQPDSRTARYGQPEDDSIFVAAISPIGSFSNWGNFYSTLTENTLSGKIDLSLPFKIGERSQTFKVGGLAQQKDRDFDARIFGYAANPAFFSDPDYFDLIQQEPEDVLAAENISGDRFYLQEITNAADQYTGESELYAGYAMLDSRIGDKVRLVWGVRYEQFRQAVNTAEVTAGDATEVQRDSTFRSILPSINFTYKVNDQINIRLSGSQTVARPEFRERVLFSFFNFRNLTLIRGNPDVMPTDIYNGDIRFEYFPEAGGGQLISVSAFYKYFDNPIATRKIIGEGGGGAGQTEKPINEGSARAFGLETEIRKNFDFIGIKELTFSTNLAWINSSTSVEGLDSVLVAQIGDVERSLIYQSPFIINFALSYQHPEAKYSATVLFNTAVSRREFVGNVNFPDILYSPPRQLDAVVSFQIAKNLTAKISAENILASPQILYQDTGGNINDPDRNNRYDEDLDRLISFSKPGAIFGFGLNWRLK